MANTRTYFKSFGAGELSPEMYGRLDDPHYQSGVATMRNFIARPQGPAENRPGFKFVAPTKDGSKRSRLIPFTFSTANTLVIEIGAGYFRFYTNGAYVTNGTPPSFDLGTTYNPGDTTTYDGSVYYCLQTSTGTYPNESAFSPSFYQMPSNIYEIPNSYAEADLFDIHYVQSADVLTLVHPNYPPAELRRYGATNWVFASISFAPSISKPTGVNVTAYPGKTNLVTGATSASPIVFTTNTAHGLALGESVYVSMNSWAAVPDGFYIVHTVASTTFSLKDFYGSILNYSSGGAYPGGGYVQASIRVYDIDNFYVVTSVGSDGITESVVSDPGHVTNSLYVDGAYNVIAWTAVTGASRYNVYKKQNGLYGYIGQSTTTQFVDNNIAPDLGNTPKTPETVFASSGNYPGAVSYYEQRRVFAGTTSDPQHLWLTRSGTESDMSYSIPTEDSDRISIRVASREANTIRHIVPLTQLLLLTSAAEWRVSPINSDALTPATISVRPQSYVGANNVQPVMVNNTVVYSSARGGHIRELGYSWQASGFVTGDLSIRASHLFDTYDIVDMCYAKSPYQVLWFVSSTGKLLGLTYVPEQEIGAWHQHDTDGVFESCAVVAEGTEDALYVVVQRLVNGNTVRYVERMASRTITDLASAWFVDAGLSFDGTNTSTTTMTVSGGVNWDKSETLTILASSAKFNATPLAGYMTVGDAVVLTGADGNEYRLTILSVVSSTRVTAKTDITIPETANLRVVATTNWAAANKRLTGLSHLEGKTVSILAEGAVMPQQVVTSGTITLSTPVMSAIVGLPYQSDLKTLPMMLNVDGYGQGHFKNVNKAWLRVFRSSGIFIGPDADHLVEAKQRTTEPYGSPPTLKSDEILIVMTPSWQASGQVFVRQEDPLPLTITSMTAEVSIGG